MRAIPHSRHVVMSLLALIFAGCSGKDSASPPPPAPPAAVNAPPPPNRVRQEANQAPLQGAGSPHTSPSLPRASRNSLPPNVNPNDVFFALPEGRGNFTIVENSDGSQADDWFVAVLPAAGADSSSFHVVPPRGAGASASPRSSVSLPEGFITDESAGTSKDGWPQRIRCEADNSVMAFVPGGVFLFGVDGQSDHALPAHPVELDPYYIDVNEVTLRHFKMFMDDVRDEGRLIPPPANADASAEHPVLGVQWGEAVRYARWAGKSLPTEAEWELAARGPNSFVSPWGNGRAVWDGHREAGQIDVVGTFSTDRSVFGVLDMAGNAKEWVFDLFDENASEPARTAGGTTVKNPSGPRRPSITNHRVVKGGGPNWELWHRSSASMSSPTPDLGFRCVLRVLRNGSKIETRTLDGEPKDDSPARPRARRRSPRPPTSGL